MNRTPSASTLHLFLGDSQQVPPLLALSLRWASAKGTTIPIWIARVSGTLSVGAGVLVASRALLPQ
jgi:hypothetical protein